MESRLERILKLASELVKLQESHRSAFARSSQVVSTTDEIIAKMEFLKEIVKLEEGTVARRASQKMSALQKRNNFSLELSNGSTSGTMITHAVINGETHLDVWHAANRLYDVENYSKCVRLIEKVNPAKAERELLLLCHGSYKHMLADAADSREASKLCDWWKAYIEKLESEKSCQRFRMEILECLAECLWEISRLPLANGSSSSIRKNTMDYLMVTKIELYQMTRVEFRPFHVKFLRRIENICFILADYFSSVEGGDRIPRYVRTGISVVGEALAESEVDEQKYRQETGAQEHDPNLMECGKLLRDMIALLAHIESEELERDRSSESESTRTSGLGTPLSSPDYAVNNSREDIGVEESNSSEKTHANFAFLDSLKPDRPQIITKAEIHAPKRPCVGADVPRDLEDYTDDESFVMHL